MPRANLLLSSTAQACGTSARCSAAIRAACRSNTAGANTAGNPTQLLYVTYSGHSVLKPLALYARCSGFLDRSRTLQPWTQATNQLD